MSVKAATRQAEILKEVQDTALDMWMQNGRSRGGFVFLINGTAFEGVA